MGKVILCSGISAVTPYILPDGRKVYSVEELCYYVYENVIRLKDDFFTEGLRFWLREKCQMLEIADKLEFLNENNYSFKDKVVALLCSADYYTEEEIISLIRKMNAWESMPVWRKKKLFADELLLEGDYIKSRSEYESTLEMTDLDDQDTAAVYHNIGVTMMHTATAGEAAEFFRKAFSISGNEDSLKCCLTAYIMDNRVEEAVSICDDEGLGRDLVKRCHEEYKRLLEDADASEKIVYMSSEEKTKLIGDYKKQVRRL